MKRIPTLIFTLFFLSVVTIDSQTLHALLFVNEQEEGRQVDRQADMNNMHAFWRAVSYYIGYQYSPQKCTPYTFTVENVNRTIDNLRVSNNDIVVFYYSGHGYNDETNYWPSLNLSGRNLRQIEIMKRLDRVASPAKLVLCIADCCNKQARFSNELTNTYDSFEDYNVLAKLFRGFKGKKSIIISASKQGQYSWSHLQYGAYFGNCFRQVLSKLTYQDTDWDTVLKKSVNLTYWYTDGKQTPQYNITLSSDPFED